MKKKPKVFPYHGVLPGKPSELILLALRDLKAVEKDSYYTVNMGCYHLPMRDVYPEAENQCAVCFAGAVMAKTLNANFLAYRMPYHFRAEEPALRALDYVRMGALQDVFFVLGIPLPKDVAPSVSVTPYRLDPKRFKREMRSIAKQLAARGY